jgi:hypothetical protein
VEVSITGTQVTRDMAAKKLRLQSTCRELMAAWPSNRVASDSRSSFMSAPLYLRRDGIKHHGAGSTLPPVHSFLQAGGRKRQATTRLRQILGGRSIERAPGTKLARVLNRLRGAPGAVGQLQHRQKLLRLNAAASACHQLKNALHRLHSLSVRGLQ